MSKVTVYEEPFKQLSVAEEKRREQLEGVVVKGFHAGIDAGFALIELQDRKLFRNKDGRTFERYCKDLFDIARGTAYRYIAAAKVVENVSNWRHEGDADLIEMKPANEAQARPLAKLPPEQQRIVWQMAVETAPDGKLTASHIGKTVKQYLGGQTTDKIKKTRQKAASATTLGDDFKAAFDAFLGRIDAARAAGYKDTPRERIVAHLDALRAIVAEDGSQIEQPEFTGGHHNANKLESAGYRLFRTDEHLMSIKERAGGGWRKHAGPFATKVALKAAFAELMQDPKHLGG